MRGHIRRESRALSTEKALDIIRTAECGVLATINAQNQPCTVSLNHVLIGDNTLYFHCGPEGEKLDNIRNNPEVSYFVTGESEVIYEQFTTSFSSAVIHGKAVIVDDAAEKLMALTALVDRFSDDSIPSDVVTKFINDGVDVVTIFKIEAEFITGKARPTKTRPCLSY